MKESRPLSVLALASEFKGTEFLEECKRLGCKVSLLAESVCIDEAWPWASIDEHWQVPDLHKQPDIIHAVSYLTRGRRFDCITALDDYDVETAAQLREHLRLDGMGESAVRYFRDKLTMRTQAQREGLRVPAFVGLFHDPDVNAFLDATPAPWVLKPRSLAGSDGIRVLHQRDEVWATLERMGDRRSHYLLEQFIEGDVYHVDSVTWDDEVVFASVSRYGTPPLAALQGRGVFTTRVLADDAPESVVLRDFNAKIQTAMKRGCGVSHTEFILGRHDQQWYFLETAARVGGGNIDRLVEAASGLHLWREAARIEVARATGGDYTLPALADGGAAAGMIASPVGRRDVDLSLFDVPELVLRTLTGEFLVLVVRAPSYERVEALIDTFATQLGAL